MVEVEDVSCLTIGQVGLEYVPRRAKQVVHKRVSVVSFVKSLRNPPEDPVERQRLLDSLSFSLVTQHPELVETFEWLKKFSEWQGSCEDMEALLRRHDVPVRDFVRELRIHGQVRRRHSRIFLSCDFKRAVASLE